MAGSEGERLAAEYIAAQLARVGARPLPGESDMFVPFEFTAGSRDGGSRISIARDGGGTQAFAAGQSTPDSWKLLPPSGPVTGCPVQVFPL